MTSIIEIYTGRLVLQRIHWFIIVFGLTLPTGVSAQQNTDQRVILTLNPTTVAENAGQTVVTVTATLDGSATHNTPTTVSVEVGKSGDSATEGTDYATVDAITVTIAANESSGSATFTLIPVEDGVDEVDETVSVSGTTNDLSVVSTSVTITDVDLPQVKIQAKPGDTDPPTIEEGEDAVFKLTRIGVTSAPLTVTVNIAGSFRILERSWRGDRQVVFASGDTEVELSIPTIDNTYQTHPQDLTVSLQAGTTYSVGIPSSAIIKVTDNEVRLTFSLPEPSAVVESAGPLRFEVVGTTAGDMEPLQPKAVGVLSESTTTPNSATSGVDYRPISENLVFRSGSYETITVDGQTRYRQTKVLEVEIFDDTLEESAETFTLNLRVSPGQISNFDRKSVTVTILDDDTVTGVTLSVAPSSVSESSSGQVVTVTGTLNGGTRGDATTVSVEVGKSGDSAVEGTDYTTVDAITVTIAANQASGSATFTLSPVNDAIDEADETVTVSGMTNGLSVTDTTVTITDDDNRGVTVDPTMLSVGEGSSEEYTVVLTSEPTSAVTVGVSVEGDDDITVDKPTLLFTMSDWSEAQTVTVSAAEDTDAVPGKATIKHSVSSSGDYSGETASSVRVTERDTDSVLRALNLTLPAPAYNDVDGSGDVTLGDVLTYTATATNSGNVPLSNVVVKDLLVNTSGNTCGTVAIGGTCVLTGTYTVVQADVDAGKVDNTARATADNVTDQSASQTTVVSQKKSLSLAVTASVSSFSRINTNISYTYTVTNSGTVTLSGSLSIRDNKVTGITCNSVPEGGLGPAGKVECEGSYTTVQADVDGDGVTNEATASLGSVVSEAVSVTVPWIGPLGQSSKPSVTLGGASVLEDGGNLEFSVSMSRTSLQTVTVGYSTSAGTAQAGVDYTEAAEGSQVIIAPNSNSAKIQVAVTDDVVDEMNETVTVTLHNPDNATLGMPHSAVGTIVDDDEVTGVTLGVSPSTVSESSSGVTVTVTASLDGGATRLSATTVSVSVGSGTATSGTDFASVAAFTITIGANETNDSATFTLSPVNDAIDEDNETVTVSGMTNGLSVTDTTVTITDDDNRGVTVDPTILTVGEGSSEEYTVVLTSEPTSAVTVGVSVDGDADIKVDKPTLLFTMSDWSEAQTVTVSAAEDTDAVPGKATIKHSVVSSGGDYSGETASSVSVTERDTDSVSTGVTLRVSPAEVSESSSGQVVTVTGTLNGATRSDATTVSVEVGKSGDSAVEGTDYTTVDAITVTIAANQASGSETFTLSPVNDAIDETDKTVSVSGMTSASGLTVDETTVTITDDDDRGVTVDPTMLPVGEGSSEEYTVVLTSQPTEAVTVGVSVDGDDDITVDKTSLTFTMSDWSEAQTVTVRAAEDDDTASGEATIKHSVSSSGDYSGVTASSVIVMELDIKRVTDRIRQSNSEMVVLSVSPAEVLESSSGQTVTVAGTLDGSTRSDATTVSVTVGSGSATSGTDFASVAAFIITIGANQPSGSATFTLRPVNDAIDEDNETVSVSGMTNGLSVMDTTVTITDDDNRGVTVDPTTLTVGEDSSEEYTVVLTSQPTEAVTVGVSVEGDDDITVDKPSLTFTASDWSEAQTVTVRAAEDRDAAPGKATIKHSVSSGGDYSGETASSVSVTERDTDSASTKVTLSVVPSSVSESSSGQTVTVTGTLNGATRLSATTVRVTVGSGSATSGTDFASVAAFTITIGANEASGSATFTLSPVNDAIDEADETVLVSGIDTVTGLTVNATEVTIIDDDTPAPLVPMPQVAIFPASQTESGGDMVFEVRLSKASEEPVTAVCKASDGTAMSGEDYEEEIDLLTITPGSTTGRIKVKLIDDDEEEGDETFLMVLSDLMNAEFAEGGQTAAATGTILDDDDPGIIVSFEQSDYSISEGGDAVQIRVHISSGLSDRVELPLSVVHGNGATKADYSGIPEKVVFETWDDVKTFEVMAIDDDDDDDDEIVTLDFDRLPDGISTGGSAIIGIIDNDDPIVTVSYGQEKYEIVEGGVARLLSVRLSAVPLRRVEISLVAVPDNGATEADYSPIPERIVFLPHQVERWFDVRAIDDDEDDDGETVKLSFGTLPDRVNEGNPSTLHIIDNDNPEIKVSFGKKKYEIVEGGSVVQVSVHLSADPERRVVIPLWMSPPLINGATEADYSGVPEQVIFESGETIKTFAVMAIDDDEIEDDESMRMRFSSLPDRVTWSSLSTLCIIDNDNPGVTVSYGRESYEIVEGGSVVQVTVHLSADPRRRVEIPLVVTLGDGATEADYSGVPERVIFESGETVKTFELLATDDDENDDGETLTLGFGSLPDRVNNGGPASVSLVDNDDPVVTVFFAQSHYTATEGGGAAKVQVFLSADPEREVVVPLLMSPGDDATAADYSGVPERLIFMRGETKKDFELLATDDDENDDGETLTLRFGTLPDRVNNGGSALVSLLDNDDPVVAVSFDQSHYTATEGDAVTVTVALSADPERRVEIPLVVTLENGATEADYSGVPEQIIFMRGETKKTFALLVTDDDEDDDGETMKLGFGTLPDLVNNGGSALVSLVDNDDPVVIVSFNQSHYTATEGGDAVTVTVALSADPEREVVVPLLVSRGNGATEADYSGVPEQIIFESGEQVRTFELFAVDDDVDDDGETLMLSFGTLPDRVNNGGSALVSLVDNDDPVVMVSFDQSHYTATEGGDAVTVTVALSADPEREVVVPLLVSRGNGATEADYSGVPEQIIFESGEQVKTFELFAVDDDVDDDGETLMLSFGTLPDRVNNGGSALVSLVDNDDPVVMVSFDQSHYTATEGGDAVTVTVRLSADPERRVEIPLWMTPGTGVTEADCSGMPERVIFESGETVKTFAILAIGDDVDEDDETLALSFGALPQRVSIGGQTIIKITDNDERGVTVSVAELAVPEGGENTYTIVLHSMPTEPVTLQISGMENTDVLVDMPQFIFTAENWYVPQEVVVRARDDDDAIADGVVILNHAISGGDYGAVVVAPVAVTIIEDDVPVLSVEDQRASEDAGEMVFTAMLNVQSSEEVRVSYETSNGTAEAGTDYKATQGTLRFAALETHQTFSVPIINDDLDEGDETFTVVLRESVHAILPADNARVLGTIVDEDAVPRAMEYLLSSVGRLVATETVEIMSRRFESQRLGNRPSLMLGGRILSLDDRMGSHPLLGLARNLAGIMGVDIWMPTYQGSGGMMGISQEPMRPLSLSTGQPAYIAHAGNSMDSPVRVRRVTLWEVLSRSAFELPLNHQKEQGGQWILWGQGAASRISGQPSAARTMHLEGFSGYLGIDYQFRPDALLGLTLTHILGDMDYGGRDEDALVPFDFNLTSLMPYFYYQVRPRLGLWGILGIGRGRADITEIEESLDTPLMLFMGASGVRRDLASYRNIDLAVKADAFFVSTGSKARLKLPKLRENIERVRLLFEGRNTRQIGATSQLTQSLEVGTRWDMGRLARGAGIDLGGGLEYAHQELGLGVAARGRYLLVHGRSGYEEWGASLMVRTDPGWGKQGLVLSAAPVWGVPSQGAEAMWRDTHSLIRESVHTSQQVPRIRPDRMEVDFGYRFVRNVTGVLIMPYSGFSFGGRGWQSYRLGGRVGVDERMDLNLEGERSAQGQSSIRLRAYMHWQSFRCDFNWSCPVLDAVAELVER